MIIEVLLPGEPPAALAEAWPRWEQSRQMAILAHLLHEETTTRFIKSWLSKWGCHVSLSELDAYRTQILTEASADPGGEPTTE
jgi:hypothetical protein